jgi:signal transduction histidine kinase
MVRLMCDNVPDLIWAKDLKKRFIFTNKAICTKLLNAEDTDEPIGKTDMYFASRERHSHPEDPQYHTFGEICRDSDSVVMKSKKSERFDEFGNVKGQFLFLDVHKAPFWDEQGNLIGTVGCGRDVSKEKQLEEERKQVKEELIKSHEILRNLFAHLQSVREEERTRISREIHDELGQALTALKMDLYWLDNKLPTDQKSLRRKSQSMLKLLDKTIQTVKRISTDLRPGLLDDLGLVAAIEWQADEFHKHTGIECKLTVKPEDMIIDQEIATAIFRIFQETLTNVARHAKATIVQTTLKEENKRIILEVKDNGIGITKDQITNSKSLGLIGIRERIYPFKGNVSIGGTAGRGTTVKVTIPH